MSTTWFAEATSRHDSYAPVIRIGNHELTQENLDAMLETAEFIRFLRAHDSNWEKLWQAYKVLKRLDNT